GYYARRDADSLDLREVLTKSRLDDAAEADIKQTDIKVSGKASLMTGANQGQQVRVDVSIDASRISLTTEGPQRLGQLDMVILCGDAKQNVVGRLSQQMHISLDPGHYAEALKNGLPYAAAVPVTSTPTYVKIL